MSRVHPFRKQGWVRCEDECPGQRPARGVGVARKARNARGLAAKRIQAQVAALYGLAVNWIVRQRSASLQRVAEPLEHALFAEDR